MSPVTSLLLNLLTQVVFCIDAEASGWDDSHILFFKCDVAQHYFLPRKQFDF